MGTKNLSVGIFAGVLEDYKIVVDAPSTTPKRHREEFRLAILFLL